MNDDKDKRLKNKWNIFKENNPTAHICVLIICVNVIFILLSSALISVLPENQGHSFWEILRLAFTLMVNPSGKYIYSEAPISLVFTTIVVLLGMISLTGGTVGFITSIINGFLEKAANSKRHLKLKNHIVILNYNKKVPSIIYDYCFDDVENTFITILTRNDKNEIINEIDNMYNQTGMKKKFKNIIVRDGNPMSKLDLDKIALFDAKTVMIMTPQYKDSIGESAEEMSFEVSKLFMFVTWYFSELKNGKKPSIVVETGSQNMEKMVREYHLENADQVTVPVGYNEIVGKMLAVTALMPSVNDVMRQLFSFQGVEVYIEDKPSDSIENELKLNNSVLPLFDNGPKRVYIAEDENEFKSRRQTPYELKKKLPKSITTPKIKFDKKEILIIGVNSKLPYILESLSCFKSEYDNKELHVILADVESSREVLESYYKNSAYAEILVPGKYNPVIIEDIYNPLKNLDAITATADGILLLSDEMVSEAHIDEKPLLYWTNMRSALKSNKDVDIIVEILDAQNQSIVERKNKDQIIVSDDFLGHLYAQLGKNPRRLDVIKDMITSEGDSSSRNTDEEMQNEGDLLCVECASLFNTKENDLTFESKRELILWIYEASGKTILPVGVVKDGVSYLFARTNGAKDGLDSAVLLGIDDEMIYGQNESKIVLNPKDELIFFMVG